MDELEVINAISSKGTRKTNGAGSIHQINPRQGSNDRHRGLRVHQPMEMEGTTVKIMLVRRQKRNRQRIHTPGQNAPSYNVPA